MSGQEDDGIVVTVLCRQCGRAMADVARIGSLVVVYQLWEERRRTTGTQEAHPVWAGHLGSAPSVIPGPRCDTCRRSLSIRRVDIVSAIANLKATMRA